MVVPKKGDFGSNIEIKCTQLKYIVLQLVKCACSIIITQGVFDARYCLS